MSRQNRLAPRAEPSTLRGLGPMGFPRKLRFTHKYFDYSTGTSAGVMNTQQFSCNGLFDPNTTGVGHQPVYFDQLTPIYNHYTVMKSFIVFRITSTGTNDLMAGGYIDDDTSAAPNFFSTVEQSGSRVTVINHLNAHPTVFSLSWDAKKYFGGDILDNDNLQGNVGANPTEQSYFTFQIVSIDSAAYTYTWTAEIVYDAIWDEIKTIGTS